MERSSPGTPDVPLPALPIRRRPRILRRIIGTVAVVVLLGATAFVAAEWTWFRRMATYPDRPITDVDWYEPVDIVRGGVGAELLDARECSFSAEVLSQATAWCNAADSSALLVVHRGEVALERYWRGHHAAARTMSMSMAKTLVGLLIGAALDDGSLPSLDAPASRWLNEWASDGRSRISLRQLLQMCSGLGSARHDNDPTSDIGYMHLGTDSLYIVAGVRPVEEPGTRFEYNSINTQALAIILERATGRRYAGYLSERLWHPIGAGDAAVWLDEVGGLPKASSGILATARDWARVGLLLQHGGRVDGKQVVSAAYIAAMMTPSALEPDYGFHVWLGNEGIRREEEDHDEPFVPKDLLYIDGKHYQRVYVIPSLELVMVRVGERSKDWDDSFLPNLFARALASLPR
jgi:CubicO group peptidase (beta-lactamase class C family)